MTEKKKTLSIAACIAQPGQFHGAVGPREGRWQNCSPAEVADEMAAQATEILKAGIDPAPMAAWLTPTRIAFVQIHDMERRVEILRQSRRRLLPEADTLVFLYDGYVTVFGRGPSDGGDPCPACLGDETGKSTCAECRGTGALVERPRQDALCVFTYTRAGDSSSFWLPYVRVGRKVLIEQKVTPLSCAPEGASAQAAHEYGRVWEDEGRPS